MGSLSQVEPPWLITDPKDLSFQTKFKVQYTLKATSQWTQHDLKGLWKWSFSHFIRYPVNTRGLKNVFKTSFVRYGCQKDVSYTSCVHRDGLERMAFFFLIYWFMANKSHNQLNWKVNFKMHAMSLFFIRRLWWRSITYYILGIFLHYYLYSI